MSDPDLAATAGQTIGPFFGYSLPFDGGEELVPAGHPDAIRLTGRVLDGAGDPVPDALVEIWQADPSGTVPRQPGSLHRDGYTFTGWGRSAVDRTGRYSFTTLVPGATSPGQAPFFAVTVFARGLINRLFTRAYLPGHDGRMDNDALLRGLHPERRRTLVAEQTDAGLRFDIRLQGPDETVFLRYAGQAL